MKIKTNGIELNYVVEGNGPWLVMSHSLACDLTMWDEQAAVLRRNFKVLRFDTRGHGASDAPEGEYTLDMIAYDVHGLLQGVAGERGGGRPVAMARELHAALAGSERLVIALASPLSNLEQPTAFNRALATFLNKRR